MANYPGHSNLTLIEIMRLKDAFQEYSSSKRREQIIKEVSSAVCLNLICISFYFILFDSDSRCVGFFIIKIY